MYIYCNSKPIKTFVRFGKRLSHGKSVNYLAMNPRIKEIYSVKLAELQYGYITEEEFNAWCEDALDSFVWEPHISCFEMDPKTQLPVVKNVSQAKTLIGFIQRFEDKLPCQAFLVRGIQTGTGTDQEPLVDVTGETEIAYDIEDLIDVVDEAFQHGFELTIDAESSVDDFVHIKGSAFQYKDKVYIYPKDEFIADFEYTGPVMQKFKYEEEVAIDYDDIHAIFISANQNGGVEELREMIVEWNDDVYDKPYYFENRYHVAITIKDDDLYVCGSEDALWDFVNDYPVEYEDIDVPPALEKKYKSMKFYE